MEKCSMLYKNRMYILPVIRTWTNICWLQTGPFVLKSPPMSTFHQQLWLIADITTDSQGGKQNSQVYWKCAEFLSKNHRFTGKCAELLS
jgi:hypothetical protein